MGGWGMEVMAEQFEAFNRDSVCEGSWPQSLVRWKDGWGLEDVRD